MVQNCFEHGINFIPPQKSCLASTRQLLLLRAVFYFIKKKKEAPTETKMDVDDKTYTLEKMREFVKRRLDEITKVNLYDIGLSEEELKRRKKE